jgi:hypothetical protein
MGVYDRYQLEKQKMKFAAQNAKPENPRYAEELNLKKALIDFDQNYSSQLQNEDARFMGEMSERWKKNGGGNLGDAIISGLQSGMRKGSILDDKKRMEKHRAGIEKMEKMVESTNMELANQRRLYDAKQSIMPNWVAYSKSFSGMNPADREQAVDTMINRYNEIAGTNYRRGPLDGKDPWMVTLIDGDQSQVVNMMDFMKTPEEMKLDMLMNSPGYRQMEGGLQAEQNRDTELKNALLKQRQEKANEAQGLPSPELQSRKQELISSGKVPEGAILFDEIKGPELKVRLETMKEEIGKLKGAEDGIRALNKMEDIFDKHPNIATSLARWANKGKDDSLAKTFLKDFINKEERDAVLELDKHAATLALGTIQQFKGQRPTDILKKLIQDTNPGSNFTKGAFKPIKEQYIGDFEFQKKKSKEEMKGYNGRYFPSHEKLYTIKSLRDEHPELKDVSDEDVWKAYQDSRNGGGA